MTDRRAVVVDRLELERLRAVAAAAEALRPKLRMRYTVASTGRSLLGVVVDAEAWQLRESLVDPVSRLETLVGELVDRQEPPAEAPASPPATCLCEAPGLPKCPVHEVRR